MSSMPEVHTPTKETVADPAAVPPTTTASEANKDPIRASGTDALVPESRPEVTENVEDGKTVPTADAPATEPTGETAPKGASVVESQPINEGILNYKGPGLVKSLIFSKKFFWFSDEPLEHKHLSNYLGSEKPDVAHRNAAHATQTGKGLLFFAKRAEDKNHPAGILNLGEMTDFVKGDFNDFSFKIHGQKHTFQAPSRAERDGWLVAVETRSTEAKGAHEGLVSSSGYKSELEKFAKPTGAAATTGTSRSASRPKKATESKTVESAPTESKAAEPKSTEATAGAATTAAAAEGAIRSGSSSDEAKPKSKSKSRSQSRKRGSLFGTLLGKKEEHDEKKELKKEQKEEKEIKKEQKEEKAERKAEEEIKHESKKEDKAEKKAEKEELKLEQKEAAHNTTGTSGHIDAAAIAARVVGAPLATEGETAPATTGTTENTTGGTDVTGVTGKMQPTSATTPAAGATSRENASKAGKRGSIFGNFFKKDATSPTATETAPAVPAKNNEPVTGSSTAPQLEDPVSSSTTGATTTANEPSATTNEAVTSPITSSTSPDTTKSQRRTSFFNNLGTKKEKKSEAISDAEGTDGEGKKSTGSKLGGLFRKPSRAIPNSTTKTESTSPGTAHVNGVEGTPALISKEEPATTNSAGLVSEPANKTETQQAPIQASV